jgi:hypothetical protein
MDKLIDDLGLSIEYSSQNYDSLSNSNQHTMPSYNSENHKNVRMNEKSETKDFQYTCGKFTFVANIDNRWFLIQKSSKSNHLNSPISIEYNQYMNDNDSYTNVADSCSLPSVVNTLEGITKYSSWRECDVRRYALLSKLFGAEIADSGECAIIHIYIYSYLYLSLYIYICIHVLRYFSNYNNIIGIHSSIIYDNYDNHDDLYYMYSYIYIYKFPIYSIYITGLSVILIGCENGNLYWFTLPNLGDDVSMINARVLSVIFTNFAVIILYVS